MRETYEIEYDLSHPQLKELTGTSSEVKILASYTVSENEIEVIEVRYFKDDYDMIGISFKPDKHLLSQIENACVDSYIDEKGHDYV